MNEAHLSISPSSHLPISDHHTAADRCNTTQSKTLPHVVYNLFSLLRGSEGFTAHHKITAKKERRKKKPVSVQRYCSSVHLQCHLRGTWVTIGGNSAEIVPLMKTNWRNQGSFLLPSQEANPNNMKLPKPRFSFVQNSVVLFLFCFCCFFLNPWKGECMQKPSED